MRYKLLKDLPWAKEWEFTDSDYFKWFDCSIHKDFFEPIVEKKTYDDLAVCDKIYFIDTYWVVDSEKFTWNHCRSETFATREEAEDEHKRREWRVRRDKFIPEEWEEYWYSMMDSNPSKTENNLSHLDILKINNWLVFKTEEECKDAIDNHDIVRLFYTII